MIRRVLGAVLVAVGLFATGLGVAELGAGPPVPWPGRSVSGRAGPPLPYSRPVRITIPSIGVRAPVEPVDRAPDGTIGTPPLDRAGNAGWYEDGPAPGEAGTSVIVGHVDDRYGPAVFYRLAALRPGTRIEVARRDRRVAVFLVTRVREYPKAAVPVDVFTGTAEPDLRLVTCGGRWLGGRLGYADNVVVFATLTT